MAVGFRDHAGNAAGSHFLEQQSGPLCVAQAGPVIDQLQPLVEPQVLHFMQVPLRTSVKLPQPPQASPS